MNTWKTSAYAYNNDIKIQYNFDIPKIQGKSPLVVSVLNGNIKDNELLMNSIPKEKYSCYVLSVTAHCRNTCQLNQFTATLAHLIIELKETYEIDPYRVYLLGSSDGANLVWSKIGAYQSLFAGAIPILGYGNPHVVRNAKFLPIWAFGAKQCDEIQGDYSNTPLVDTSKLVTAIRNIGSMNVKYTEYKQDLCRHSSCFAEHIYSDITIWNWLFSQNRRNIFEVYYLKPGVFRIDDYNHSSCYLIQGKEKALLIDTGMGEGDFMEMLQSLTGLPISLAVTHTHFDHIYHIDCFNEIYINKKDIENWSKIDTESPNVPLNQSQEFVDRLIPIDDGDTIDLGDVIIKIAGLCGHTKNSLVFIDSTHKCVYMGDAIGSGDIILLICTENTIVETIRELLAGLLSFEKYLPNISDYALLGGHFIQENSCNMHIQVEYFSDKLSYFNPLSSEVFRDLKHLCINLLADKSIVSHILKNTSRSYRYKSSGIKFMIKEESSVKNV
ncbi:MAG: MBL fold metallo-hydrolase [Oscillospiraceae bacterium]